MSIAPTEAGLRVERLARQLRDVRGHAERLEGVVHRHGVGARRHGDRPDAIDVVERRRDRGEPGDLGSTA